MKTLNELTLLDKFLFDEVMDIPEAHEAALRIILGDENLRLLTPSQTEKELRTAPWLRSIRLDVYSMDENLRIYNTEAQKTRKPDLPRRSRFYQSVMDSSLLKSGDESFNLLNDTFNIMITPFDLFGKGNGIAAGPAAKAVKALGVRVDVKGGRFFTVEGAQPAVQPPLALELHIAAHQLHDVGAAGQFLNVFVWDHGFSNDLSGL